MSVELRLLFFFFFGNKCCGCSSGRAANWFPCATFNMWCASHSAKLTAMLHMVMSRHHLRPSLACLPHIGTESSGPTGSGRLGCLVWSFWSLLPHCCTFKRASCVFDLVGDGTHSLAVHTTSTTRPLRWSLSSWSCSQTYDATQRRPAGEPLCLQRRWLESLHRDCRVSAGFSCSQSAQSARWARLQPLMVLLRRPGADEVTSCFDGRLVGRRLSSGCNLRLCSSSSVYLATAEVGGTRVFSCFSVLDRRPQRKFSCICFFFFFLFHGRAVQLSLVLSPHRRRSHSSAHLKV